MPSPFTPTAHPCEADRAVTPLRVLAPVPTLGLGRSFQLEPFQQRTSPSWPRAPTAQALEGEVAATPLRDSPEPMPILDSGVGWCVQASPSQWRISARCPVPSSYDPTAQAFEAEVALTALIPGLAAPEVIGMSLLHRFATLIAELILLAAVSRRTFVSVEGSD